MICQFCGGSGKVKVRRKVYRKCQCQIPTQKYNRMKVEEALQQWASKLSNGEDIESNEGFKLAIRSALSAGITLGEIYLFVYYSVPIEK